VSAGSHARKRHSHLLNLLESTEKNRGLQMRKPAHEDCRFTQGTECAMTLSSVTLSISENSKIEGINLFQILYI